MSTASEGIMKKMKKEKEVTDVLTGGNLALTLLAGDITQPSYTQKRTVKRKSYAF